MDLNEKARELAEVIKETEQYGNLKSAEARLKLDPDAQDLLQNFQDKQQKLQEAQQSGEQVDQDELQNLQGLQNQMQENETIKNLMDAQQNFDEVMKQVNETVVNELKPESEQ